MQENFTFFENLIDTNMVENLLKKLIFLYLCRNNKYSTYALTWHEKNLDNKVSA